VPGRARLVAVLVQRGAGALQRALDRGRTGAEHVGHLVGGEAEHVAQHERGGWRGGMRCRPAMKASSIDSVAW
jgi:hypothetical protein